MIFNLINKIKFAKYIKIMELKKKIITLIILVNCLFSNNLFSQNLYSNIIINGAIAYYANNSNYDYIGGYSYLYNPLSGSSTPGQSTICSNPVLFNSTFISSSDHTNGFDDMLVVDGGTVGSGQYFWKGGYGGNGFCGLTIGKVYTFSYWIKSVSNLVTNTSTQADVRIDFSNASNITLNIGSTIAPLPADGWRKVEYSFTATNYCVNINLWDFNTNPIGNDFAVDDFSLTTDLVPLSVTYSLSYGNCEDGTTLAYYTLGGNVNISTVTLTGLNYYNTTGNFKNLQPGNYVLTVVDIDGNSTSVNVVIPQNVLSQLTVSPNVTICEGVSTTLSVSGSSNGYFWTSTPNDPSLIDPTSANPIVSPTSTTMYNVSSTSTIASGNLIDNGDFSNGNSAFGSYYRYYPTNFENASGSYGVVTNNTLWGNNYINCGDHTTGTGKMLVVKGSDNFNGLTQHSFWRQFVNTEPQANLTFSFWIRSLSNNLPASIRVIFNGAGHNVYPYQAPSTNNCSDWVQYSMNYYSAYFIGGLNIELIDTNSSYLGNDFAIDDISLTTTSSCSSNNVTVFVNPTITPIITHNSTNSNSITFNWNTLPNAIGYSITYTVNNGTPINAGTITTNSFTVNSLNAGDSVNLIVTPIGTGCFSPGNDTGSTNIPCTAPIANISQQPTCSLPTGSINISTPLGSQYEYSVDGTTFQSSPIFNNLSSGNYTVTLKNTITGCQSTSGTLILINPGTTLPDISASYNFQNCSINLIANSITPNTSIKWNGPGIAVDTQNPAITNLSGTYIATVTDLISGCTNNISINVTNPTLPNQPTVTITNPSCTVLIGSIEILSPIGNNYEYSINGSNYQSSINFNNLVVGNYAVTVKDVNTGCISSINQVQIVPATIAPPIPTNSSTTFCQNSISASLSAIALPNATLNWYGTNATGGIASSIAPIPDTSISGTIIYYCSQTLGNCESPRTAITVVVSGSAIVPNFNDLTYCFGDKVMTLSTMSPNGVIGSWQPSQISNTLSGNYTFTPDINQCASAQTISVTIKSPININFDWQVNGDFEDYSIITITTSNAGDYLYQLDDNTPQSSPVFYNVSHGIHSITVYDKSGCSNPLTKNDILIIKYNKFFTPNNDGYNDYWTISDLFNSNAIVHIFDRFGKLLKELNLNKKGVWDGRYNGYDMPSSDYWFVVYYKTLNNTKIFKSHFTLKR
jgi:gliding motility-associated-like protein